MQSGRLRSTGKIPIVNDLLNKKDEEEIVEEPDENESYGKEPFTLEQLKKLWDEFAKQKKNEGKDSEYAVLKQDFTLENSTITLKLTNAVKIDILNKFRSDLITHLKAGLNNKEVVLETDLLEEEATKLIYTNKEKFNHLAEKKPIINQLKDRLGLDPDF